MSTENPELSHLSRRSLLKALAGASISRKKDIILLPDPARPNESDQIQPPPWYEWAPDKYKDKFLGYEHEYPGIVQIIKNNTEAIKNLYHGDVFLNLDLLEKYYPIYRFASDIIHQESDPFYIPWHLTWMMHVMESNMSTDPEAFKGYYYGGMQMDPNEYVEEIQTADKGYEFLNNTDFNLNHSLDAKSILAAVAKIRRDGLGLKHEGMWGIRDGIVAYCGSEGEDATNRYNLFAYFTGIFNPQPSLLQ